MMKSWFLHFSTYLVLVFTMPAQSQSWQIHEGLLLEDPILGNYKDLYEYVEILYDSTGNLTLTDITSKNLPFEKNTTREGYNASGVYWIKTTIEEIEGVDSSYLFSVGLK